MAKQNNRRTLGNALAGHAFRACSNDKKALEYANPLTDFINLIIAEAKAKLFFEDPNSMETENIES